MSEVLMRWNRLPPEAAAQEISACCGSGAWAREMAARRPFEGQMDLVAASDEIWKQLKKADWLEAFSKHPRIGERKAPQAASAQSRAWSEQEQQRVAGAADEAQLALLEGNREYEKKFGRVFIVCATGKSGPEILEILRHRLGNDDATELHEAAEEQRKITNLRLRKWLWG
jgi:2-oxo-4-hydroxy-4-carboxy-5-ureidoimidazoline decarboxylase